MIGIKSTRKNSVITRLHLLLFYGVFFSVSQKKTQYTFFCSIYNRKSSVRKCRCVCCSQIRREKCVRLKCWTIIYINTIHSLILPSVFNSNANAFCVYKYSFRVAFYQFFIRISHEQQTQRILTI